jgi:uncharacterized membrane protein YraQ (UPF0718 family)
MSGLTDKTMFILASIVFVLYIFSFHQTGAFPWAAAGRAGNLFANTILKILFGFLIGAILPDLIPSEIVEEWLSSQSGWKGVLVGWIAGSAMPMGAPFVLYPLAAGLVKGGAGVGPIVAMLTGSALLGPLRAIVFEIPIMGGEFFAIRLLSVIWVPPLPGFLAERMASFIR